MHHISARSFRPFPYRCIRLIHGIAANKRLVISLSAVIPLVLNPLFSVFMGIPQPQGTDEFSYLLVADTFIHGRLSNPAHPLWKNLQTFAQTDVPSRAGITAPLLSAFMAFGQYVFHLPIAGVWLCIGLMNAAIAWMLYGWTRPVWALFGSFLAFLNLSCYTYWSHTYWGGSAAALAGSMVFGALPRLYRNPRFRYSVFIGLGCALLANSRPFEGCLACLPVAGLLIALLLRPHITLFFKFSRIILPISVIFLVLALQIGFYNKAITGDPLIFPEKQLMAKSSVPMFIWQKSKQGSAFTNDILQDCDRKFAQCYYQGKRSSFGGMVHWVWWELTELSNFYFGPLLVLMLLASIPFFMSHRWYRFAFFTALGVIVFDTVCLSIMTQPNYFAPVSCLMYLLAATAFRLTLATRIGKHAIGRQFVPFLLAITVALTGFNTLVNMKRPAFRPWNHPPAYSRGAERGNIIKQLASTGNKNLVIVRYGVGHYFSEEWVYNAADIDGSPVVFAHEMDSASNHELIEYFSDRKVWLLDVFNDNLRPRIIPYKEP